MIKISNISYLHYLEAFDPCFGGLHCGDSFKFLISSKVSKRFPHLSPAILSFLSEINFAHPSLLNFYRANGFKVITVDWTEAKNKRVFAANYFCQNFVALLDQFLRNFCHRKSITIGPGIRKMSKTITAKLGVCVQKILICQIITNYQSIGILSNNHKLSKHRNIVFHKTNSLESVCWYLSLTLTAVAHKLTKLQTGITSCPFLTVSSVFSTLESIVYLSFANCPFFIP